MNLKTFYENYTNSFYDMDSQDRIQKSIFISLVSYRDTNVINTIQSLIFNAKRPENLTISLVLSVYQNPEKWHLELKNVVDDLNNKMQAKIILNIVEATKIFHLGELKNLSNKEYNKEDFYMSVSSSSEFDPYWDDILIKEYMSLSKIKGDTFIFTCNPRGFLFHDNIIPGYVFYTNHKTGISLQREEYDGCRIPISGYNNEINNNEFMPGFSLYDTNDKNKNIKNTLISESFLEKYNFVIFNDRKFLKDEFIAVATGVSDKFIFSDARQYFKINKINDSVIDKEDFNFISFINFMKNNISIFSIRWTPIYHLYDDESLLSIKRVYPIDNYVEQNLLNTNSYKSINKIVNSLIDEKDKYFNINNLLSVDWEKRKFKEKKLILADDVINLINNFISLYNFSTNENSLHWNSRHLK